MTSARNWIASSDSKAVLGLAAVLVIFFSAVWAQGHSFLSDGQHAAFFAPLAVWSDAWIGGWPAGSDTAAYVWYPLRVVLKSLHFGFDSFVVAAYITAAIGTYVYLRVAGVIPIGSVIGGLGFALCGFMMGHLGHTSMIQATSWIPWMFAGVEGCIDRQQRRWSLVATFAVAMSLLAGHMQVSFYGLVVLSGYIGWRSRYCWKQRRMSSWCLACVGVVVGVLLAGPQLLMTAAYVENTPRAALDYASFVSFSLPIPQLSLVMFPYLFGAGTQVGPGYFGFANFPETCCYVSFLSFALAIPGLTFQRSIAVFWALVAFISLVFALGGSIPLIAEAIYKIPGFNMFRAPSRHVMEFGLAMSVLSGFGVQVLSGPASHRTRLWYAAGTLVLAVVAIGLSVPSLAIARSFANHAGVTLAPAPWLSNRAIWLGLSGIAAGLVAFGALVVRTRYSSLIFAVSAVVGLASFAWYAEWRRISPPMWVTDVDSTESEIARQLATQGGRILYTDWLWGSLISAERSRMFGMPSVNWYGPLIPKRAGEVLQQVESGAINVRSLQSANVALDIYGVRYVAVRDGAVSRKISEQGGLTDPRWQSLGRERDVAYYKNTRALPLGWMCPTWREVTPKEALKDIQDAAGTGFNPGREALVEGLSSGGSPESMDSSVDAHWVGPGTVQANVNAHDGGFLVFSVNDVPGWTASVDGTSQQTYTTDYALVGLPLRPGQHTVVLEYHVPAWRWVAPWSGALAGLLWIVGWPREKHAPENRRA